MDLAVLLVLDAVALIVATIALTYFFLRDMFKEKKKGKK
jgi:hypothetical protein